MERVWFWNASLSMDKDDFLVVEVINVALSHRRIGIGRKMAEELLKLAETQGAEYAFVWPMDLHAAQDLSYNQKRIDPSLESETIFEANKAKAVRFWRSIGFRLSL